jgi:hypothetical protein
METSMIFVPMSLSLMGVPAVQDKNWLIPAVQSDQEHDFCGHRPYDPEFSLNASQHVAFQSLELSKRNQLQYSH